MFNNREIATAVWLIIFSGLGLLHKQTRQSIFGVMKIALTPKLVFPFILLFIYSFLIVLFLRKIHLWSLSNLKETIYWFFFSGVIIAFGVVVDEKTERPYRKIIKELTTFTIILEFIVNTYVFALLIELIFVLIMTILVMVYTVASVKSEYKVAEKILGTILAIIGIVIFTQAIIQIYRDFDKFASFKTLIDFILPPVLTISLLPAIYLLQLYVSYESVFVKIDIMLDSKERQRYAKKLLIFHCGFKVKRVKEILKHRANVLYSSASKEEIKTILLQDEGTGSHES